MKNDVNVNQISFYKNYFLLASGRSLTKRPGSGSANPYQYVKDSKHCYPVIKLQDHGNFVFKISDADQVLGSGLRCFFDPLDPDLGKLFPDPRSLIPDPQP